MIVGKSSLNASLLQFKLLSLRAFPKKIRCNGFKIKTTQQCKLRIDCLLTNSNIVSDCPLATDYYPKVFTDHYPKDLSSYVEPPNLLTPPASFPQTMYFMWYADSTHYQTPPT